MLVQNYLITKSLVISLLFATSSTNVLAAGDGHNHSHSHADEKSTHTQHNMAQTQSTGMFLKKKEIDGYTVSFHVMEAKDGMRHGGSHNLMVKVEKDGMIISGVVINSKVIHPNKKFESKMLMKMGDWFMGGFDLGHKGRHELMILFKTSDGKKHKGGVYYAQ